MAGAGMLAARPAATSARYRAWLRTAASSKQPTRRWAVRRDTRCKPQEARPEQPLRAQDRSTLRPHLLNDGDKGHRVHARISSLVHQPPDPAIFHRAPRALEVRNHRARRTGHGSHGFQHHGPAATAARYKTGKESTPGLGLQPAQTGETLSPAGGGAQGVCGGKVLRVVWGRVTQMVQGASGRWRGAGPRSQRPGSTGRSRPRAGDSKTCGSPGASAISSSMKKRL